MALSELRTREIAAGYLERQARHSRHPRQITAQEARRLQTWLVVFWLNQDLQARVSRFIRARGDRNGRRRLDLRNFLVGRDQEIDKYEDDALHSAAKSCLPAFVLDTSRKPEHDNFTFKLEDPDILALNLVRWFKESFMRWIDPITCPECNGSTRFETTLEGNDVSEDDRKHGAGRVELHRCEVDASHPIRRFPRYNAPGKLLETREGRCGEFANLFMLFLRSAGLDARIVNNQEDHVWNEYYSESAQRWVHLDSCEAAFDTPLMYELGWGKKMSYVLAFGLEGGEDVSRGYVADYHEHGWERRRKWDEQGLVEELAAINLGRRGILSETRQTELARRDTKQEAWMADHEERLRAARGSDETLKGRQSGTEEWRAMRAEGGSEGSSSFVIGTMHVNLEPDYSLNSAGDALRLAGSASRHDEQLFLTPNKTSQVGSAFVATTIPSSGSFVVEIDFRISLASEQDQGADGMAFVCLSSLAGVDQRTLGEGGAGLGYDGLGSDGDWAVEIDTYQTVDRCNDPPTPHISLHSPPKSHHRHCVAVTPSFTLPNLSDGQTRTLRIAVDEEHQKVQVELIILGTRDEVLPLWEAKLTDRGGISNGGARLLGLTAATGGISQAHEISRFDIWDLSRKAETDA